MLIWIHYKSEFEFDYPISSQSELRQLQADYDGKNVMPNTKTLRINISTMACPKINKPSANNDFGKRFMCYLGRYMSRQSAAECIQLTARQHSSVVLLNTATIAATCSLDTEQESLALASMAQDDPHASSTVSSTAPASSTAAAMRGKVGSEFET